MINRFPRAAVVLAATGAALAAAAPAAAQQKPAPCQSKPLVTDPKGDAFVGFIGLLETPVPAGPNVDITSLFVNSRDGRVTFNVAVADLSKTVGTGATANSYRVTYDVGDASFYLQASVDTAGTVAFSYGHIDTTGLVKDGDGKGTFFEGPDGVIEMEVPPTHGGKPGTKWTGGSLFTAYVRGRVNTQTDEAPDGGGEFSYNGASCPAGAAPAPSTPAPTAPAAPQPPTGGPTAPATTPTGALRITASPTTLKAKKVKRARRVAFNLRPSESMRDLVITLRKGSKRLGAAKLAELQGARTVALKLKRKGLKKGRYTLQIDATRPDGSKAQARLPITVK